MSPCQRSLKLMRSAGWLCAVVEKWNPHARLRQDLFGMFDILAIRLNDVVGIQTTTKANMKARIAKIRQSPHFKTWLQSPQRKIVVHGWFKWGPRGKRKLWDVDSQFVRIRSVK